MPLILPSPTLCTPLASLAEFKAFVTIDDAVDDSVIERVLCAATSWIESDQGCGREFSVGMDTRQFYPERPGRVLVDDLVTVTSIKIDTDGDRSFATTLATTDYLLWPLDGPPYAEVRSWPTAAVSFVPTQLVEIEGMWGSVDSNGNVPAGVKQLCLLLSNRWFARRQSPFGVLEVPATGHFQRIANDDPDIRELVMQFMRNSASWVLV